MGLPAVTLQPSELPETALRRLGHEKLNTGAGPVRMVGVKSLDRGGEELVLMEMEARLTGEPPDVTAAQTQSTRYVDQQWTEDLPLLREAARQGSLCSQILLEAEGISY